MGVLHDKWDALVHGVENMTKKDDQHALYLVNPDTGDIELVDGEDVEAFKAKGYKEPEGQRANGYAYNRPEDLAANDAAADQQTAQRKADADKAAEDAKAADKQREANEKAQKDAEKSDK